MRHKLLGLIAALVLWMGANDAAAFCRDGTISYKREWVIGQSNTRFTNGATAPLRNVNIVFRNSVTGAQYSAFANASGVYQVCGMPQGGYGVRLKFLDGNGQFKLVAALGGNALDNESTSSLSISNNAPYSFTVGVTNGWNDSSMRARTQTYAAMREFYSLMDTELAGLPEYFDMGLIQVVASSSAHSGPHDIHLDVATLPTQVGVVWHEMGHTLQQNLQEQVWGTFWLNGPSAPPERHIYTTFSVSGACAGPPGYSAQTPSSNALTEGWADFVENRVWFTTANLKGSLTCNTSQCPSLTTGSVLTEVPTNQTAHPACGTGSFFRSRDKVRNALIDLIDTNQADSSCFSESAALPFEAVTEHMMLSLNSMGETVGTATRLEDTLSLVDFLAFLQDSFPTLGAYRIWANSCFQPGKSDRTLNQ